MTEKASNNRSLQCKSFASKRIKIALKASSQALVRSCHKTYFIE